MNKTYLILSVILILIGIIIVILPERNYKEDVSADKLLAEITDGTRFYSTDDIARMIIDQDPSFILIDVRDTNSYKEFHLPGAVNIPLNNFLAPEKKAYLDQKVRDIVFYSNASVKAEKAWLIAQRLGYDNTYVMKGGLNAWIEDIIRPTPPPVTASNEAFDQYKFRLGASLYFGGSNTEVRTEIDAEPVIIQRKIKKTVVEGGC